MLPDTDTVVDTYLPVPHSLPVLTTEGGGRISTV